MAPEDAEYYADELTQAQRAVISLADAERPTLLEKVATGSGHEHSDISKAVDQLLAMNLIKKEQSRLAGKFFHSYVLLNERGLQVRAIIDGKASAA